MSAPGGGGQGCRSVGAFSEALGRHNRHPKDIGQVAIDMSPAYIKGVSANFGNAAIVYDKYHVLSQVAAAVE